MVESAALNAVAPRVTSDAPDIAFSDLGHESLDGASWVRKVEQLLDSRSVVEVQPPVAGTAIDAPSLLANRVEDLAVALDVLADAGVLRCTPLGVTRLRGVAFALACLVTLPSFGGVEVFATGHMGILVVQLDTWGNEFLGTAEMGEQVA